MTTLDAAKNSKRGFFSIYKPGQGNYVRWGTVAGLSIFAITGAIWVGTKLHPRWEPPEAAAAVVIWLVLFAFVTFWFVNTPKIAEFLIMTESEMRKVTWPTRHEVITSTKIVILLTLLLAFMLCLVDYGFAMLFRVIHIL